MSRLGETIKTSEDSREVQHRLEAIAECDSCGKEVELWSDTEEWVQNEAGEWKHNSFGPAQGECCGNLYVFFFEGCFR